MTPYTRDGLFVALSSIDGFFAGTFAGIAVPAPVAAPVAAVVALLTMFAVLWGLFRVEAWWRDGHGRSAA